MNAMRKRNLLIGATVAWALFLLAAAALSYRNDPPTVPGQTTVGQARATMEQVAGEVIAIAPQLNAVIGDDNAHTCEITKARDGTSLSKTVTLNTPAGTEGRLLRGIAEKLPAAYEAHVSEPEDGLSLYADAGGFVAVRGRTEPGKVTITMTSGCRTDD